MNIESHGQSFLHVTKDGTKFMGDKLPDRCLPICQGTSDLSIALRTNKVEQLK